MLIFIRPLRRAIVVRSVLPENSLDMRGNVFALLQQREVLQYLTGTLLPFIFVITLFAV